MKQIRIRCELYRATILVRAYTKENIGDNFDANAMGGVWRNDRIYCCGLCPDCKAPEIAHEALHITNRILSDRGVIADFENDEAQTYLMTFLFEKLTNAFSKIHPIDKVSKK